MFNFSANHLLLISLTEYPSYAVLLMRDRDTQRVYRLYDFSQAQLIRPNVAYCVAGKVNSADKLYLVIESVRLDTKCRRLSTDPVPAAGAGGSAVRSIQTRVPEYDLTGVPASSLAASAPVCTGVGTGAPYGVKTGGIAALLNRRQQTSQRRELSTPLGTCQNPLVSEVSQF